VRHLSLTVDLPGLGSWLLPGYWVDATLLSSGSGIRSIFPSRNAYPAMPTRMARATAAAMNARAKSFAEPQLVMSRREFESGAEELP
jgi:hypothetical protein